ncbi:MAG: hypothetical protein AB7D05_04865 [Mangrovibacterium sp.]
MRNNKKLVAYLVFVGIATIFWFLNALNKQYSVELTFPVKYTNWPKGRILVSDPPREFVLRVNSFGFTLLRYKLSMAFSPLIFNVNVFTSGKIESSDRSTFKIATRPFINRLSSQVSNELKITGIYPDTLVFRFEQVVSRLVKVQPVVSYTLKRQHFLNGKIITVPDSVRVSGPGSLVDTLSFVASVPRHFKEINHSMQQQISLAGIKQLEYSTGKVMLEIPVEEYTEKQLQIPVTVRNLPADTRINLFPEKVNLSFMIGLSRFREVTPEDFLVTVSFADILQQKDLLELKLEKQPPFIQSVSIFPEQIEYLIEQ